jgi:RNA polymerase sigma-70 factor (ECF subfamily)
MQRTSPDFEDLLQLTFERIIRTLRAGGFEGRSTLTTWAQAIAVNVALDATRRRVLESRYLQNFGGDLRQLAALPSSTEARLEARSSLQVVQEVLSRMSPVSARATALRHVLECRVEDVARRLGLSTTAAASRIRRGRLELERRLNVRATDL